MDNLVLAACARTVERIRALVIALHSPMDAGSAARISANHLLDSLQHERFATFDADRYINYQQHRPAATFEGWHFTEMMPPEIAVELVRDDQGEGILLLHGPEPALRWGEFSGVIRQLIGAYGVEITYTLEAFPYGAPHTRPVQILRHGTRQELVGDSSEMFGHIQIPAKLTSLIEFELGEAGHDAVGFAAAVPHYIVHNPYPAAAAALVRALADRAGLALPVGELEASAAEMDSQLRGHLREQPDVAAVVAALELQYDTMKASTEGFFAPEPTSRPLPTAEEIGAAAEAFLAEFGDSQAG